MVDSGVGVRVRGKGVCREDGMRVQNSVAEFEFLH